LGEKAQNMGEKIAELPGIFIPVKMYFSG